MEGCDGDSDDECEVFQGGVAKGQLEFTSDVAASTLKCQLHGIIGGSELPFPSGCTNGCDVSKLFAILNFSEIINFNDFPGSQPGTVPCRSWRHVRLRSGVED